MANLGCKNGFWKTSSKVMLEINELSVYANAPSPFIHYIFTFIKHEYLHLPNFVIYLFCNALNEQI